MLEINKIYFMDAIQGLKKLEDKSVDLIIVDPPYNIGKAEWDNIVDYRIFCSEWIMECERVLKNSGSMYIFHNVYRITRDIDLFIDKNTRFEFRQLIIWNKRFKGSKKYGYLNGYVNVEKKRNYEKMCEYILFYTFNNSNMFLNKRKELGLTQKIISNEVRSINNGLTGWVSNIEKGLGYPNEEHIKALKKHLKIDVDKLIPIFNNQKTHHSVWNYDIDSNNEHLTPKPIKLIENILLHSSNENGLVLNVFCGSGNVEIACVQNNRNYISFENNKKYYNYATKRLNSLNKNTFL